jgi:gas vesicle protein
MINGLRKKSGKQYPFVASNNMQYGVTLSKQVKDLYGKNFKTLKKELKEDIRKWKDLSRSKNSGISIVKTAILPKAINQFNAIPIKIPTQLFNLERTLLNFLLEKQKT